ncbi:neuraminidase-like domain-containing protein, partial [Enhygromyxa salina]|uniref:neuraminidase-like domain-containing protein n=1 Tax=Enhygromyxa salina TaxID=215803 RepID=UPI001C62E9D6
AEFVDQVEALTKSGFSVDELDWLLRHRFTGAGPLDDVAVARTLGGLALGLLTIDDETSRLEDPDGQALTTNLAALLDADDVTITREIVEQTSPLEPEDRDEFIDTRFGGVLDVAAAKAVLDDEQDVSIRRTWLLQRIVGHLRRRALVLDTIVAQLGVPAAVAEILATTVLSNPAGDGRLFEVYRQPFATREQLEIGLSAGTHPTHFAAWTRLAKAALVCVRFELRADQAVWYSGRNGWLNLDALPLDVASATASFESWACLCNALALRDLSRPGELAPALISETVTLAEAIGILADHAGWDADAVLALATSLGYDDTHAAAVAEEDIPPRLKLLIATADQLGVGVHVLRDWASPTPTIATTAAIKAATRAKYGEDRWAEIAKPLRDVIRQRQRDALVDAAIARTPKFRTANDVFEHLLIDVEMSACMMTSRIKQAIASVQIFIHRVLLHLDVMEVTFDPEAIQRWGWMKNYRVWEANRKVFLYPENWIEPELRGDKTPEFAELEATLMQGVLDPPRVEKALSGYLEQLARVANLEMIGVDEHPHTGELWLLGRTHASPHEWFVRRRLPIGTWEAWEAVPTGIDSDAAAIVLYKGRLHLFWATEHEQQAEDQDAPPRYRFRVHHIERAPDGWGKPTMSKLSGSRELPPHDYRLHLYVSGQRILATVLWQDPESFQGRPVIAPTYTFDPVEQRARGRGSWMGWHEYDTQFAKLPNADEDADPVEVIALRNSIALGEYDEFEGQRNVSTPHFSEVEEGDDWAAHFVQGDVFADLFKRASSGRRATFVHHANIWKPRRDPSKLPAIYDDRSRKYLIEPQSRYSRQANDPGLIGHFNPASLVLCPPPEPELPDTPEPRQGREQRPKTRGASGKAPPARNEMVVASREIPSNQDEYPPAPKGFVLEMVELYHPFARDLQEALASGGLPGLYAPPVNSQLFRQRKSINPFGFADGMGLNLNAVRGELPIEEFDFSFDNPYATYNWEIFYHVPMLVAGKLATEQRWEEAQGWYHLMFNPIDLVKLKTETATSKFWRIKPFFEQAKILATDQIEAMLGIGVTPVEQQIALKAFTQQVETWVANPFDPHAVARVRPGVYQRALLREYFDNLIAWADNLFRRDTIESITE